MLWLAALTAPAFAVPGPLTFHAEIVPGEAVVRLADVVDLSPLPSALRTRAAEVEVARLTGSEDALSSRQMSRRARFALPGLSPWLPEAADRAVRVQRPGPSAGPPAIAEGDSAPERPLVLPGEAMIVRVTAGPVVVEREVRALQAGRAGRPLFVRTADGDVLRVRLEAQP